MGVEIKEVAEDEVAKVQMGGNDWVVTAKKVKDEMEDMLSRQAQGTTELEGEMFTFILRCEVALRTLTVQCRGSGERIDELMKELNHKKEFVSKVYEENCELTKKNREVTEECKIAQEDCVSQFRASSKLTFALLLLNVCSVRRSIGREYSKRKESKSAAARASRM